MSTEIVGKAGTGISIVRYGAAFIPGAQPIAGGLIATGNTLSTVSSGISAGLNFYEGDYTRGALNLGNAIVPGRFSKGVSSMANKGQLTRQGGNILNGGINVKSSVADFMINRKD
ncbi:MAG: hypothetical protein AAF600_19870 [Bacteroidota bacterium]